MKYGAVRWRQEAAERGHGDPAGQRAAARGRRFHTLHMSTPVWIKQDTHHRNWSRINRPSDSGGTLELRRDAWVLEY